MIDTRKTKNRKHTGNIRKHGNGWEGTVMVNGQVMRFYDNSKERVKEKIKLFVFENDGRRPYSRSKMAVEEFAIIWLNSLDNLAQRTRADYERDMYGYFIPAYGDRPISSLSTGDIYLRYTNCRERIPAEPVPQRVINSGKKKKGNALRFKDQLIRYLPQENNVQNY